jgi:hypothetical protein
MEVIMYNLMNDLMKNLLYPHVGKANTPYAKSVKSVHIGPANLPDPGILFDGEFLLID